MTTDRTDELLVLYRRLEGMEAELADAKLGRDTALSDLSAKNSLWASLVAERDEAWTQVVELEQECDKWERNHAGVTKYSAELKQELATVLDERGVWMDRANLNGRLGFDVIEERDALRAELAKYRVVATAAWRVWNTVGPPMAELGRDLQNLTSWLDDTRVQGSPLDAKSGQEGE